MKKNEAINFVEINESLLWSEKKREFGCGREWKLRLKAEKVVVSVYNLWVKESWETVGVVGKYLIGTRIYQIWVPLKCNSSFLDSGSKWVKIIHKELEFSRLKFHVFFFFFCFINPGQTSTQDKIEFGKLDFGLELEFNKLKFQKQSNLLNCFIRMLFC